MAIKIERKIVKYQVHKPADKAADTLAGKVQAPEIKPSAAAAESEAPRSLSTMGSQFARK